MVDAGCSSRERRLLIAFELRGMQVGSGAGPDRAAAIRDWSPAAHVTRLSAQQGASILSLRGFGQVLARV